MLRMTDIADRAGVSQTTVSFVLSGRESSVRISQGTRDRVLAAAEELGYRSNHLARAMRTGTTNTLGFIGGDLCCEHVGKMLDGALEEAETHGFSLKILPHREGVNGMEHIVRRSSELRLTGIAALHLPLETLKMLRAETLHCGNAMVLLDTPAQLDGVTQVMSDDRHGIFLVVEHLVKLGHRRIAMISGNPAATHSVMREEAFQSAMQQFGLEVPDIFVTCGDFRELEPSRAAAQFLLGLPTSERPTAIFCIGDLVACAAMQIANKMALNVPRDVSIVGFGDLRVSLFGVPTLTTVHQPFREMGRQAVRCLLYQSVGQSHAKSSLDREPRTAKTRDRALSAGSEVHAQESLLRSVQPKPNISQVKCLPIRFVGRESTSKVPLS